MASLLTRGQEIDYSVAVSILYFDFFTCSTLGMDTWKDLSISSATYS